MSPDTDTLEDHLRDLSDKIPVEIRDRISAAILEDGAGPSGLAVGQLAPDFTLQNATGEPVALAERLALGPVVLSFYRGEWCPYCNLELRALQAHLDEIHDLGASLLAISPQSPDHGASLTETLALGFDVLSDVDRSVSADYGLLFTVAGDLREVYENLFGLDIAEQNADGTWRLPIPATFVLDGRGVVRASHVSVDYRTRMEPAAVVAALDGLVGGT